MLVSKIDLCIILRAFNDMVLTYASHKKLGHSSGSHARVVLPSNINACIIITTALERCFWSLVRKSTIEGDEIPNSLWITPRFSSCCQGHFNSTRFIQCCSYQHSLNLFLYCLLPGGFENYRSNDYYRVIFRTFYIIDKCERLQWNY